MVLDGVWRDETRWLAGAAWLRVYDWTAADDPWGILTVGPGKLRSGFEIWWFAASTAARLT